MVVRIRVKSKWVADGGTYTANSVENAKNKNWKKGYQHHGLDCFFFLRPMSPRFPDCSRWRYEGNDGERIGWTENHGGRHSVILSQRVSIEKIQFVVRRLFYYCNCLRRRVLSRTVDENRLMRRQYYLGVVILTYAHVNTIAYVPYGFIFRLDGLNAGRHGRDSVEIEKKNAH